MAFGTFVRRLFSRMGIRHKQSQLGLPKVEGTIGELQQAPFANWEHGDLIKGLRFVATLQLRTPLRVLSHHGEIHRDRLSVAPAYAREQWEGIWVPVVLDGPLRGSMASDIGPIPATGGDYLAFLLAVRAIVEANESIDVRIHKLLSMPLSDGWKEFIDALGGKEQIVSRFFPEFLTTIPGISETTKRDLVQLGLSCPSSLSAASDQVLLSVQGVGPAKLAKIRAYCDGITQNRDSNRLDNVFS